MSTQYETVIGLEIHAQLQTASKLFSSSSTRFHADENVNVGPVDMGLPGSLPVLNQKAVAMAVRAGLALNCTIHPTSIWARKHYFYPDLPKGYQISQYERPLCTSGFINIVTEAGEKRIGIHRIHMEEDAGKNVHEDTATWVNLNRAGIPLIEIVSEPDIRTAKEAAAYMKKIRSILRAIQVCDGNMEEGSLRCDVNISIRPVGQQAFGTKVELKNINSFRFVERAIEVEIERQKECIQSGEKIIQETRTYNATKNMTFSMRLKEDAHDYRYFPEPDLPPLRLPEGFVEKVSRELPELPDARRERLTKQFGLPSYDAEILSASAMLSGFFETVAASVKNAKSAANWILSKVLRDVQEDVEALTKLPVSAEHLSQLLQLIEENVISGKIAKTVYETMLASQKAPRDIVKEQGLVQITDSGALEKEIESVLSAHPQELQALLSGKDKLFGFFVGQIMKKTAGKANPQLLQETLKKLIDQKKGT